MMEVSMTKPIGFLSAAVVALTLATSPAIADEAANIRAALSKVLPEYKPTSVQPTPMAGLYQVEIGPQVMFVTGDGRYLIDGAVVDLKTREDITESARGSAREIIVSSAASSAATGWLTSRQ